MELYNKPGVVKAEIDNGLKSIVVTYHNLSEGDIVKTCCLAQMEEVKKGNTKVIIVDTSQSTGVLPMDIQEWLSSVMFPDLEKKGLKSIITVLPKNALTKLATKHWTKTGSDFSFSMYETDSLDSAKKLVQSEILEGE